MSSRYLDYCSVKFICGSEIADELFERKLPAGFDLDEAGDMILLESIIKEELKCESCGWFAECHK
jgi:hypothetical protein